MRRFVPIYTHNYVCRREEPSSHRPRTGPTDFYQYSLVVKSHLGGERSPSEGMSGYFFRNISSAASTLALFLTGSQMLSQKWHMWPHAALFPSKPPSWQNCA